ncbi:MAG: DUF695 domain-containing protein [Chitinophagaceae bacterium]|nr:DUF695 domain-containing protein [Chitinophagaceae bacterium]
MGLIEKIFGKKKDKIQSYEDFWNWFSANHKTFYKVVKTGKNIEVDFFNKLSPKLEKLKDGIFCLTGMYDNNTAELIFTPDGVLKNIVFVEELVSSAPKIPNWRFTALKPALDIKNLVVKMGDYTFDRNNLSFYAIEHNNYPDVIDIVVAYSHYKENDKSTIISGTYIFLDNYLGELNFITTVDNLTVISKDQAEKELIPIEKLKDYLIWRQKEFLEKYNGVRYNTENDSYSIIETTLSNGLPLVAIINSTLLDWDSKASHPWILQVEIKFDGSKNNGMPDNNTYEQLNNLENEIMAELKDFEGYLNVGRQTTNGERIVYFACKDFRKPSKLLYNLTRKHSDKLDLSYDLYKDKYWQSFEKFKPN